MTGRVNGLREEEEEILPIILLVYLVCSLSGLDTTMSATRLWRLFSCSFSFRLLFNAQPCFTPTRFFLSSARRVSCCAKSSPWEVNDGKTNTHIHTRYIVKAWITRRSDTPARFLPNWRGRRNRRLVYAIIKLLLLRLLSLLLYTHTHTHFDENSALTLFQLNAVVVVVEFDGPSKSTQWLDCRSNWMMNDGER